MKKLLKTKLGNESYSILGCSVKGGEKEYNQDSFLIYGDAACIMCFVADGLGSAINSEMGAEMVCKVARDLILERGILDDFPVTLKKQWANTLQVKPISCDTTFKFIVVYKEEIVLGGIGDGWIIGMADGRFFEYKTANCFSNQTDSMMSVGYEDKFRIVRLPYKQIQILSIATDGFSEDIESDSAECFIRECLTDLNTGAEVFANDLEIMMKNWPVTTNQDDKTIVLCGRNK